MSFASGQQQGLNYIDSAALAAGLQNQAMPYNDFMHCQHEHCRMNSVHYSLGTPFFLGSVPIQRDVGPEGPGQYLSSRF